MITDRVVVLDEEITAEELIESWVNGNRSFVIDKLKNDHPGLTALVLAEGIKSRRLAEADVNGITNQLIDARVYLTHHPRQNA